MTAKCIIFTLCTYEQAGMSTWSVCQAVHQSFRQSVNGRLFGQLQWTRP